MAEFPHIGDRCFRCQDLDFLPVECEFCKNVFCKIHFSVQSHECPAFVEQDRVVSEKSDNHEHVKCAFCNEVVLNRLEMVTCDICEKGFCLAHRLPEVHCCVKRTAIEKKSVPQINLPKSRPSVAPKGSKGAKNDALAKKVALMKLKSSAIGQASVPQSERRYFNLVLPDEQTKPIFLCSQWSVGKCVDFLADKFKVTNNNNRANMPKLMLYNQDDLQLDFDTQIDKLEQEKVIDNGQNLIMKYVNPT
ncbi:AN1-type zinc finger protein 1-like [Brevipalpus obovatus]|uniref:AN1-type zinc finger protein 1-like n=1 Tax=Brevipalpus obovatus TaxID=246614 RepID=UPI003D9E8D5A